MLASKGSTACQLPRQVTRTVRQWRNMDEETFIAAILNAPRDDTARLVYADWLEERSDVRGEWLRVNIRLQQLRWHAAPDQMAAKMRWVQEVAACQRRLRELRPIISEVWALRVQQGHIENCNMVGFGANCPGDWLQLTESGKPARRLCSHCRRWVRFCWSASEVHEALAMQQPVVKALAMEGAAKAAPELAGPDTPR